MGRIKTISVKNVGDEILEKYNDLFTDDFEKNKKIIEDVANITSKRMRNVIAGYITREVKRMKK